MKQRVILCTCDFDMGVVAATRLQESAWSSWLCYNVLFWAFHCTLKEPIILEIVDSLCKCETGSGVVGMNVNGTETHELS